MRLRRLANLILSAGLLLAATSSVAQQTAEQTDAAGFVAGNQSAITNAQGQEPTAETIPGFAGDGSAFHGYADDPDALEAAGQNALATSDLSGFLGNAQAQADGYSIDQNETWLKNALGIANDPGSGTGGGFGEAGEQCATETVTKQETEKQLYTCETAQALNSTTESGTCTRKYVPEFDTDYVYRCSYVYVEGQGALQPDVRCQAINTSNAGCTEESRTCVEQATETTQNQTCTTGSTSSVTNQSCTQVRHTTTDVDYVYACQSGSTTSYTQQSCQSGTVYSTSYQSCQDVTQSHTSYSYGGCGNALNVHVTETEGPPTVAEFECWDNDWNYGACYAQYSQCLVEQQACFGDGQGGTQCVYRVVCQSAGPKTVQEHDSWSNSCSLPGNCSAVRTYCADSGVKNISGYSVYRDCWYWATEYQCANTTTWVDTSQCQGLANAGCTHQSSNGQTHTYACHSASNVNTCGGISSGCQLSSQSCSAYSPWGGCSAYDQTYSCPVTTSFDTCGPFGACSTESVSGGNIYKRCESPVAGQSAIATREDIVSDTWDNSACASLAANSNCRATSGTSCTQTAGQASGTRQPQVRGLAAGDCIERSQGYQCEALTPIGNSCATPAQCTLTGERCVATSAISGACIQTERTFSCTRQIGVNGCKREQVQYACENPVPGAEPAAETRTGVEGGKWEYEGACPQASDQFCALEQRSCVDGQSTRTINGVQVTSECWRDRETYACESTGGKSTDCEVRDGCQKVAENCLDDGCKTKEHVYECTKVTETSKQVTACKPQVCFNGQCYSLQNEQSEELPQAFSALSALQAAGKDHAANIKIFPGKDYRCRKDILGFRNCCKDSGWGLDIGLASCDEGEKQLAAKQEKKQCHYVGTYCSRDTIFGCRQKAMRYCCFEGSLARIIHDAGRPQIGMGWGSAKSPNCAGFTVEQFQQLDLSNVDFSDFYKETMDKLTAPNADGTVNQIQQQLQNLYNSGSPGTGG